MLRELYPCALMMVNQAYDELRPPLRVREALPGKLGSPPEAGSVRTLHGIALYEPVSGLPPSAGARNLGAGGDFTPVAGDFTSRVSGLRGQTNLPSAPRWSRRVDLELGRAPPLAWTILGHWRPRRNCRTTLIFLGQSSPDLMSVKPRCAAELPQPLRTESVARRAPEAL